MSGRISDADRELYRALANALLPEHGPMPSAEAAGVAGERFDRAMNWRPDLFPEILRAFRVVRVIPVDQAWAYLQAHDAEAHAALRTAILGSYYLDDSVRAAIGYTGQQSRPVLVDEIPDYLAAGLLDPVRAMAPLWRKG